MSNRNRMRGVELPKEWKVKLQREFGRDHLLAGDFQSTVQISFEDGSFAFFKYAFCLVDEKLDEAAVFTEHCGYHIFPLAENEFTVL